MLSSGPPSRWTAWDSSCRTVAAGFKLDQNSERAGARKRPFHTLIPGFMERGDRHIGFGIMGAANQPLAHAQFVSNIADYRMNIQAALEEPRFTVNAKLGCSTVIESGGKGSIDALTRVGHQLEVCRSAHSEMGEARPVLHSSENRHQLCLPLGPRPLAGYPGDAEISGAGGGTSAENRIRKPPSAPGLPGWPHRRLHSPHTERGPTEKKRGHAQRKDRPDEKKNPPLRGVPKTNPRPSCGQRECTRTEATRGG